MVQLPKMGFTRFYVGKTAEVVNINAAFQLAHEIKHRQAFSADVDMWLMNYIIWVLKLVNAPRSGEAFTSV